MPVSTSISPDTYGLEGISIYPNKASLGFHNFCDLIFLLSILASCLSGFLGNCDIPALISNFTGSKIQETLHEEKQAKAG